jgi:ComF family protein
MNSIKQFSISTLKQWTKDHARSQGWMWANRAASLLWPQQCVGCANPADGFCGACDRRLSLLQARPACPTCGMAPGPYLSPDGCCSECRGLRLRFHGTVCVGAYEDPLRNMIRRAKYHGHSTLARRFADLLANHLMASAWPTRIDVLTFVPPHWTRRWRDPFYLPAALARRLGRRTGIRTQRILRRVRRGRPQTGMRAAGRRHNVRGAFRVTTRLHGACIGVVDDVMTTGATLDEVARALRGAGARAVVNLVLARGGQYHTPSGDVPAILVGDHHERIA